MEKTIYIQLLDEGTKVYRPVPALQIEKNIFEIKGVEIYSKEDELWEFCPGSVVIVEERNMEGKNVLVAIEMYK